MRITSFALSLALLVLPVGALAQAPTSTAAAPAPAAGPSKPLPPGFEPISGREAAAESVSASLLVVLAYAAFLAGMFGFVIYVARGQAALAKEIKELSEKLGRAEKK